MSVAKVEHLKALLSTTVAEEEEEKEEEAWYVYKSTRDGLIL